jgi:hypothetical protein
MKKLLLLSALLIFACSSDDSNDNNDNSNSSSIDGRWNLSSSKENGINVNLNSCDLESYILFNQNGTGTAYTYYTDYPDNPEIEPCGLDFTADISYSETSDNNFLMTFDYGEGDVANVVAEINNNILTLIGSSNGDNYETLLTKQ